MFTVVSFLFSYMLMMPSLYLWSRVMHACPCVYGYMIFSCTSPFFLFRWLYIYFHRLSISFFASKTVLFG